MKKTRRWLCGIGALALGILLAGCGHEHTWADAACTVPKTCTQCGETEGQPLGHTWVEATCTEPKHCSVCGQTDGQALPHTWAEANYQEPRTCTVCEKTEGTTLPASFEVHGLTINVKEGVTYDYKTACRQDYSRATVGHAAFSDYRIAQEDAALGLEKKDGYEWRMVHVSILFDDANARKDGMTIGSCFENYYDIEGWDESAGDEEYDEATGSEYSYYTVNDHGVEKEVCVIERSDFSGWVNRTNTWDADVYVNVPVGYDGVVLGLYNRQHTWEDGMYIYDLADEDTLFFRMD